MIRKFGNKPAAKSRNMPGRSFRLARSPVAPKSTIVWGLSGAMTCGLLSTADGWKVIVQRYGSSVSCTFHTQRIHSVAKISLPTRFAATDEASEDGPGPIPDQEAAAISAEEGLGLASLLRSTHRWQGSDQRPPVAGVRQARVEHRYDTTISARPDEPARSLREERRGARQIDDAECVRTGMLAPSDEQWVVGATEGDPVDYDERERRPRDIDPLPEPHRRKQAGRSETA